jgi:rhodanese-related sulfurtransferase
MRRRLFITVGLLVALLPAVVRGFYFGSSDWPTLKRTIRSRFPEVRQISTHELRTSLAEKLAPLLIDARTETEFRISHLRHARRAETVQEALTMLAGEPKDRAIVVYCSVGYRSSALARELMRAGYSNIANLEGSIFEWANKGWPVYRGDVEVAVVHPYDTSWGKLLERSRWAQ